MSMRGSGGPRARVSGADEAMQREINAQAPKVRNLGQRIFHLFTPYRPALFLTIFLVLVVAALSVLPPLITRDIFDTALFPPGTAADPNPGPDMPRMWRLAGFMVAILVLSSALGVWQTFLTASVGNRVMGDLRLNLFSHLQRVDLAFFTHTKTGVIQSRLQNDVGGVASVLSNTVSSVVGNTVTVIASLVSMILLSWQLTLVSVIITPLLVFVQRRVGQIRARIATKTQESLSEMTSMTQESLGVSGILLSKLFGRSHDETARYSAENDRQISLQVRQAMTGQWFFAMVSLFISVLPVVIYVLAAWIMQAGQLALTAGTIVAFTTVQSRLLMPMMGLLRVALDLQTSSALFARIFEYLDIEPTIVDRPSPVHIPQSQLGKVEFNEVTFRYPDADDGDPATLNQLSFSVAPGTFAAFVGSSGAGKTTIAYLIPRLYDAVTGHVQFAGVDVKDLAQDELRSHIGMVSQETYLHHTTIAENLRYAKPEATDAKLIEAATMAHIHDRIMSFPAGYDTVVGQQGYRLSGGERQRIAIARVLLKDPAVLILDEATSALDSLSEQAVQVALNTAARGRTTIAIAHRLSTIAHADTIYVLDAGQVVEQGTQSELLERRGHFWNLYTQQART